MVILHETRLCRPQARQAVDRDNSNVSVPRDFLGRSTWLRVLRGLFCLGPPGTTELTSSIATALPQDLTEPIWPGIGLCAYCARLGRKTDQIGPLDGKGRTRGPRKKKARNPCNTKSFGAVVEVAVEGLEPPTRGL